MLYIHLFICIYYTLISLYCILCALCVMCICECVFIWVYACGILVTDMVHMYTACIVIAVVHCSGIFLSLFLVIAVLIAVLVYNAV